MKAPKLFVFAAGVLMMGVLSSCESESSEFPVTIGFTKTNPIDTVFQGDSYDVKGTVSGEGEIESVHFYRSFTSAVDSTKLDSVEMAATQIVNIKGKTCDFATTIPNLNKTTVVTVVVIEKGGFKIASQYKIIVRIPNIVTHKNVNLGGWNGAGKSAIDLDNFVFYGAGTAGEADGMANEDIYFDNAQFASSDLDGQYFGGTRFTDLGSRFAIVTNITAAQFDGFRADDAFKDLVPTLPLVNIKVGDIVLFQTKLGKKGLLKINSMDAPDGDVFFDYKIQR